MSGETIQEDNAMKTDKLVIAVAGLVFLPATLIFAQGPARDWHDFHKFHIHIQEAIHQVQVARMANHYGVIGYGGPAEDHLRLAEKELMTANNLTNAPTPGL
jgi:hypothetical protein